MHEKKIPYQHCIVMAGKSKRFTDLGFIKPKALLEADGKIIIERILDNFPQSSETLIVITGSQKEILDFELGRIQSSKKISIAVVEEHDLGPSESILRAEKSIRRDLPVVVSYCDVGTNWRERDFLRELQIHDAGMVVFTGFHPHTLRNPKFGYVKVGEDGKVERVREKKSFTERPTLELASAGVYGFRTGDILIDSIQLQKKSKAQVAGEYYISLAIDSILNENRKVFTQTCTIFESWGTPEDLSDFNYYMKLKRSLVDFPSNGVRGDTKVFIAGGKGTRISDSINGYKQCLEIGGDSAQLWSRSAGKLEDNKDLILIAPEELLQKVKNSLNIRKVPLRTVTNNSYETALEGLKDFQIEGPVSLIATDNFLSFEEDLNLKSYSADLVVWAAKEYPLADIQPFNYSWISMSDSGRVDSISIKSRPSDGRSWHPIIGNFSFRSIQYCRELLVELSRVHDGMEEIHLEQAAVHALNAGETVKVMLVPTYFSVGTQNELLLYKYLNPSN